MLASILLSATCDECNKKGELEEMKLRCGNCQGETYTPEHIQNCLKKVSEKTYLWQDRDSYIGFKSEEEKTIYLRGVERGVAMALFFVADWFDEIEFFQKLSVWSKKND